jgi:membrane protease YdiL (CAAX protease family)
MLVNPMSSFLPFRTFWKITPMMQILVIIFLYLAMVYLGYDEFQKTGLLQGFPLHISVLFVPIFEEIIFRGFILAALLNTVWKTKAIIYTSILFWLWHVKNIFQMDLVAVRDQVIYTTFIFWPAMAYLTIKTKTIWPGVILHYLNNLLALYFA